jgi:hypothetical protein
MQCDKLPQIYQLIAISIYSFAVTEYLDIAITGFVE